MIGPRIRVVLLAVSLLGIPPFYFSAASAEAVPNNVRLMFADLAVYVTGSGGLYRLTPN